MQTRALTKSDAPALLPVEQARALLARCRTVDEAKDIRDKATAIKVYLRTRNAATDAKQDAAEIELLAERRMGELLAVMPKATGAKGIGPIAVAERNRNEPPTLADLGIEKTEAHRAQRLADVPTDKIDAYVSDCRANGKTVTKGGALALVREPKERPPIHVLTEIAGFKDAVRRLVSRWPAESRGALPVVLRDLADEIEEEGAC
ncbi:MAG: hypothetical protein Q8S13_12515 [Dehalococcoidia bacterium]|nr:hypothetical protein [Dehalococcoidia bacterium]